ncbi:hypothetical protein SUGI_0698550 [Cryptomeria japonica]|nr:hypothetical protein SUGI_0698550 [Cryptomeria japonica]
MFTLVKIWPINDQSIFVPLLSHNNSQNLDLEAEAKKIPQTLCRSVCTRSLVSFGCRGIDKAHELFDKMGYAHNGFGGESQILSITRRRAHWSVVLELILQATTCNQ